MGLLSFLGTAVGAGAGFLIGGPAGAKLGATLGGLGGSALTKKKPPASVIGGFGGTGTTGSFAPTSIGTGSLNFSNRGGNVGITRTAPAFIPGQTSLGPTQFGGSANIPGPSLMGGTALGTGTVPNIFSVGQRATTPERITPTTSLTPTGATAVDPRLQEEQNLRQQTFELTPFLDSIKQNIEAQRGQVAGVQSGTEQLGADVQAFREGFGINAESLQTPAGQLNALSALAQGMPIEALEQTGADLLELAQEVGLTSVEELKAAVEAAQQETGAPTQQLGVSALQEGIQEARGISPDFSSPLDQLRQAQSELDPGTAEFDTLREDIKGFRENLAPGFNQARETALANIENERAIAAGDLREQLSRRRVAGSSFAADTLARTDAEFGRRKDQTEAEFFEKITTATNQAFGLEGDVLNTQVGQRLNAATQRAIFAAEEAGILEAGVGIQFEKAGLLAEGGDRLAQIGLLQSRADLEKATTLSQIAQNEIDAELKIAVTEGQLAGMGAQVLSDAFSQRLASLQTSGNLTAQEASVLATQSSLALAEAAQTGDLFKLEADILSRQAANIGLAMGLNEQESRDFGNRLALIKQQADILNQTTRRELDELGIAGNIANGIMNTNADIGKANAQLAIAEAKARGESQAGFASLFAEAAPGIIDFGKDLFSGGSNSSSGIAGGGTGLF